MTHRFDIQILRGVAVVLVVLFHLNIPYFEHGFLGVDAFFVLSGFLMAGLFKKGQVGNFYRRRASRLLPAYFATCSITLVASIFLTLPSEHIQVVEQGLFASVFASNIGFWSQNSYFSKAEFSPLLHLWSLGVEIQFYLIVPLLFWVNSRSKVLLFLLAIGSASAAFVLVNVSPKTAFFMMPFRIWQFLAGAGISWYLTHSGTPIFLKPRVGLSSLVLLIGVAATYPVNGQLNTVIFGHPGLAALLITLATSGVLAFGLPAVLENSLPGVILCKLGDWSYSIYLAHFPVIVLALYIPFSGTILAPTGFLQTFLLIAGIAAFSTFLYLLFDKPRISLGSFKMTVALMCSVAVLALLSVPASRVGYSSEQLNTLAAFTDRGFRRCGKLFRIQEPNGKICELTGLPDSAPALVLVGNSHADSIKPIFLRIAREQGYRLFFVVSNTPVFGRPSTTELLKAFEVVGIEGVIAHFSSESALRVHSLEFNNDAHAAGLEVVWILDVPTYKENVPAMIWKNPEISYATPVNLTEISQLEVQLNKSNIAVFDPRLVFCPDVCRIMDDQKRPFYFDDSHLTLTGAQELEDMIRTVVKWFDKNN